MEVFGADDFCQNCRICTDDCPPNAIAEQKLSDPLRELDDDSLRAADVAGPVAVLIAHHLADELDAASSQAGNDDVDDFDGGCDMANPRRVRLRRP